MHRAVPWGLAIILAGVVVSACGEDGVAQYPGATASPTAAVAPRAFVLRASQVSGYEVSSDVVVSADTLVEQDSDPSLKQRLASQGFQHGARVIYTASKTGSPLPFSTVSSQALIFNDPEGAKKFFAEESARTDKAPVNGTMTELTTLPRTDVDDMVGRVAQNPPVTESGLPSKGFLALMRKGGVVVELFASGANELTTTDQFVALVTSQQGVMGS